MIISRVEIEKFRKFQNVSFSLGQKVTVIAGQNGTMKSTLLGLIGQPFSMTDKSNPMTEAKTIDGDKFESKFSDSFKFSVNEKAGNHRWRLFFSDINLYPKGFYEAESIPRKEKNKPETIRIWSAEGRESNMGYVQCPVIFLSLKRLIPVGEERNVNNKAISLSESEENFYKEYHNKILLLNDAIVGVEHVKSSNKSSLGAKTDLYDSLTNSAGQDNIGKILLSILSFQRLKEVFSEQYKGGILLIDELDATMFPRAQEKLVESLFRFASDYSLQIVLTTHSPYIISAVLSKKYSRDSSLLYLRARESCIYIDENPKYEQIEADLSVAVVETNPQQKLRLYCEDHEAYILLSGVMPTEYKKRISFMKKITFGADSLIELAKRKVPEFCNNLVVLDGDQRSKLLPNNFCILPGDGKSPEKMFFHFLKTLSDTDTFWDQNIGGYTKQICFENYASREPRNREEFKQWFNDQEKYWGKGCQNLFKRWAKDNKTLINDFQNQFLKAFEYVKKKTE
jgi:predicted ATPase